MYEMSFGKNPLPALYQCTNFRKKKMLDCMMTGYAPLAMVFFLTHEEKSDQNLHDTQVFKILNSNDIQKGS